MTDFHRYRMLQREMARLRDKHGAQALNQPEYQAAWRASEIVKNRNGGLPPTEPQIPSSQSPAIAVLLVLLLTVAGALSAPIPEKFFRALHTVETSGRTGSVLGDGGRALGPYQIHRAYWQDSGVPGNYQQVTNEAYARRVVTAYLTRYARAAVASNDFQTMARIHNGGPQGHRRAATLPYWTRVQRQIGGRP